MAARRSRLRDAVSPGGRAAGLDDARVAIIACYVAMEGSLARAGDGPRRRRDARRAAGPGGRGRAGRRRGGRQLTALFYEARFSSHALPAAARGAARDALAAVLADALADRAAREAAAAAGDPP